MAALALTHVSCAQDATMEREAQLKAAYVFNFMKFVDWDARGTDKDLDVCFTGAREVRDALALAISDKSLANRQLTVRSIKRYSPSEDCEVIYVDASHASAPPSHVSALTVGDAPTFTQEGGMIRLYTESNRLRFIVNVGNARRAGLQISSNLLKLATSVEQ
jgi:hypothetical protein